MSKKAAIILGAVAGTVAVAGGVFAFIVHQIGKSLAPLQFNLTLDDE